jgi:inosine-uridine nucleoside N-ribohydrolase
MIDVIWDMETNDPDDFLTLLLLAGHPDVNLKAVTIIPGTASQIGIVRYALRNWFNLEIPVGVKRLETEKVAVSDWHYEAYGKISASEEAESAADVLLRCCDENTTIITGAALSNIRSAILATEAKGELFKAKEIVVQGGFAGEGVVPAELQLEKFKGKITCPTFNLMGDKKAAHLVLEHQGFPLKRFVSKNVCHRVLYDFTMHSQIAAIKEKSVALERIWQGMNHYLEKNSHGKLIHDILAACCAIEPSIATWREVELFREGAEWGARLAEGSNTWIIIDYNHEAFMEVFSRS